MKRLLWTLPLFSLMVACQQPPSTPAAAAIQPTYDDIVAKVFTSSCATRSCHGAEGGRGGLVLTADQAYANLVNVVADNDAAKAKGKKRVVPGDPDNSFLLQKLTGPATDEGDLMPDRGQPLDPAAIAAIRTWIANGAQR